MVTEELSVTQRLQALETQNRRLRRIVALLAVGSLWPLLLAAEPKGGKSLEVERLVLRDAKGATRAELSTQPDRFPILRLLDEKGDASLILRGSSAGPILEMADGHGGTTWLSSSTTGSSLSLSKNGGEIELATNASGYPSARLRDKEGKLLWNVPEK